MTRLSMMPAAPCHRRRLEQLIDLVGHTAVEDPVVAAFGIDRDDDDTIVVRRTWQFLLREREGVVGRVALPQLARDRRGGGRAPDHYRLRRPDAGPARV